MTGTGVKQLPDTQVNFLSINDLKVKLEFTHVLLNPEFTLVQMIPFLNTQDTDLLASYRGHCTRIYTFFQLKIQILAEQDKIWEKCYCGVHKIYSMIPVKDTIYC